MPSSSTGPSSSAPIVAVVGATAAGKTGLSLDLAERLGGEIVNTDAMAVYRGMDIGTAKPPAAERRGVPHHLFDLLEVTEPLTVAEFQGWAREAIAEVRGRGRTPVLVVGSALYTRAVVDRFEFPGTEPDVRRGLEAELAAVGPAELHRRLAKADPEAAARILPDNGRRIVRALEVVAITGRPFSASLPEHAYADPRSVQIGVDIDRPTLDPRIERTARTAIGYREVTAYLAGETTLAEASEATTTATRRFSRRQDGWFRKDPRVVWVPWDAPDRVDRAVAAVAALD